LIPEKTDFRPVLALRSFAGSPPERRMATYFEKLRDPRWQKRRLEIMSLTNFSCEGCGDKSKTLNVHHKIYRKRADPWDYADNELACLCEECHEIEHASRTRIDEAISRLSLSDIDAIAGYAEGCILRDLDSEEQERKRMIKFLSCEWADGVAAAYGCGLIGPDIIEIAMENDSQISAWLISQKIRSNQKS
jgi:hypothetical protein